MFYTHPDSLERGLILSMTSRYGVLGVARGSGGMHVAGWRATSVRIVVLQSLPVGVVASLRNRQNSVKGSYVTN